MDNKLLELANIAIYHMHVHAPLSSHLIEIVVTSTEFGCFGHTNQISTVL